jgi:hypothetical protein
MASMFRGCCDCCCYGHFLRVVNARYCSNVNLVQRKKVEQGKRLRRADKLNKLSLLLYSSSLLHISLSFGFTRFAETLSISEMNTF